MKSKCAQALRIPSLLLAAALQVMPMVRAALPVMETSANILAIVFRWAAGAAAALGGVQAVSGASTVITNPLSTNIVEGVAFSMRLTTAPDQAHYWAATGLPTGLGLSGTNGQTLWRIVGTPTVTGTYNVGLTAKDQASSGSSRTVTATLVITISAGSSAPSITTQPASQTVSQGQSATFSVTASGSAPLSYQWRFNNVNLSGQTASSLVLNPATTNNAGNYVVVVSNSSGSVTSAVATLTVTVPAIPPAITTQPADATVTQGQNASFNVGATGTAPLRFFWRKNTAVVANTTSATFSITNAQPSDAGPYSVIVSNSAGTTTSSTASLTVNPAPQPAFIGTSPSDAFVPAGGSTTFSVVAGGTTPLSYQWHFNNAPLSGKTTATLALSNVQAANAGGYYVVVTNIYGSATSAVATLTLVTRPTISVQPRSQTNYIGGTATFSVTATSPAPLTYQWRKDGVNLADDGQVSGSAGNNLQILDLQTNDGGGYTVVVTNTAGAVTSRVAVLSVELPPPTLSRLTIRVSGKGSVTPDYDGKLLAVGTNYTITALPGDGYLFADWTGDIVGHAPVLAFVMQSNLVLQANFVPASDVFARATYSGLFYEPTAVSHLSSGSFTARTTDRGSYSGRLMLVGRRYSFSGRFDSSGRATNVLNRGRLNPLTVEVVLDVTGSDQIRGSVSDGTWVVPLLADRSAYDAVTNPAPQAGTYTLVIAGTPAGTATPAGDGFGSVKVNASGRVRFKGVLADGIRVAEGGFLSRTGDWPMYVSLFSGEGSILGWLTFTNRSEDDINGWVSWNRLPQPSSRSYPAGFSVLTEATGSSFTPTAGRSVPLDFSGGQIELTGGGLAQSLVGWVTPGGRKPLSYTGDNRLVLSVSPATGLFRGRIVDPATRHAMRLNGAILQKQNIGSGFFLHKNRSGRVYLGP